MEKGERSGYGHEVFDWCDGVMRHLDCYFVSGCRHRGIQIALQYFDNIVLVSLTRFINPIEISFYPCQVLLFWYSVRRAL